MENTNEIKPLLEDVGNVHDDEALKKSYDKMPQEEKHE